MYDYIQKLIKSDRFTWSDFVDRAYPVIEATVRRYTDAQRSEDLIQNCFEALIRDDYNLLKRFKGDSELSLLAYVKSISKNLALNEMRKKQKERTIATANHLLENIEQVQSHEVDEKPLREALFEATESLDVKYKEVMILRIDGYSHREIAEITGIPLNTVITRVNRAQNFMRVLLKSRFF